jgi:hypothetical protein
MGGNVTVIDSQGRERKVDKTDFGVISRSIFIRDFNDLFVALNNLYAAQNGEEIWPASKISALLAGAEIFVGSSSHIFNRSAKTDEEILSKKRILGDIDITVPESKIEGVFHVLASLSGPVTERISYVGKKQTEISRINDQINVIFEYTQEGKTPLKIQVDFVATPYEDDKPSQFSRFFRSSDWGDIERGIKGSFHKLLLRSITKISSIDPHGVLLTPASPLSPPEKVRVSKNKALGQLRHHSISAKGLRRTTEEQPITVGGKRAYKTLETDDPRSSYETNVPQVFLRLFGPEPPLGNELKLFESFTGLLQLMEDRFDNEKIGDIFEDFVRRKLFGHGTAIDAYDPKVDENAKRAAINTFIEKFPFLSLYKPEIEEIARAYYENYKTKTIAEFLRRNLRFLI